MTIFQALAVAFETFFDRKEAPDGCQPKACRSLDLMKWHVQCRIERKQSPKRHFRALIGRLKTKLDAIALKGVTEGLSKWEYNINMERYRITADMGWYYVMLNKAKMTSEKLQ